MRSEAELKNGEHEVAAILLAAALAASFPAIDVQRFCSALQAAGTSSEQQARAFESCIRDEEKSRTLLSENWGRFPADARQLCTGANHAPLSYLEIWTCLQVQSNSSLDADLMRKPLSGDHPPPSDPKAILPERLSPPAADGPGPKLPKRLAAPSD
jgi:hypothetical protein